MEAPVDQDTNLELDPLLDGKPVELVSDVIRDRFKLSFSHHEASRYSKDWLQLVHLRLVDSGQKTVAVVQSAGYKSPNKS